MRAQAACRRVQLSCHHRQRAAAGVRATAGSAVGLCLQAALAVQKGCLEKP